MRPSTRPANYCATLLPIHSVDRTPLTVALSFPSLVPFPFLLCLSRRDRLTTDQRTRDSGRKQQVAELDLTTSEILVFYRET
ncbi:hypothetical protein ALC56_09265 [Trachymyrmex septentrionalis]|uniref:Uncharacterized protein n=1 Tax=Trachymyrmex septentrionalis TaxID=34720 RepID=A0A195F6T2_9HYME|nr:hypothetical protein ALC56_09265 [Trachymyrmex septentrionalis]